MGYALAKAGIEAGAEVCLISGPVNLIAPIGVKLIAIETAEEMFQAVMTQVADYAIYIGAAAVADYTPIEKVARKIKKQTEKNTVYLQKTQDILAAVASLAQRPFVVGFAAETHDLETYARSKLVSKKVDMIAANWVGRIQGGFEHNDNALQVFWDKGHKYLPMTDKEALARQLIVLIIDRWKSL
jgi:phosphopantothenoylcysteine decarboxylase/phosphopantothenate--cysteine ligase